MPVVCVEIFTGNIVMHGILLQMQRNKLK